MPPIMNPSWALVLGRSLRMVPRTAMRAAGRVMRDMGSKDPAVARAAMKMVGMHAAVGAGIGGGYAYATGGDVRGGLFKGALAGGGLGMMGGSRMLTSAYQSGYGAAARKNYMGALTKGMGQGASTAEGRKMIYQAMHSAEQRGLFGTVAPMPGWVGRANEVMSGQGAASWLSNTYHNARGYLPTPNTSGGSVISAGRRVRTGGGYGSARRVAGRRRR